MNYRRNVGISKHLLNVKVSSRKAKEDRKVMAGKVFALIMIISVSLTLTVFITKLVAKTMFYENERYTIRTIAIENPAEIPEESILQIAGVKTGDNLFALDLVELQKKLESIPRIKTANVARQLPDTLIIRLTERQPVARLVIWSGKFSAGHKVMDQYLVDDEGILLGLKQEMSSRYPILRGIGEGQKIQEGIELESPEALAACRLLKRLEFSPARSLVEITQVDVSHRDQVTLILADGGRIKMLSDFVDQHIERMEIILKYSQQQEKIVQTADLTVDRNVPVVFQQ